MSEKWIEYNLDAIIKNENLAYDILNNHEIFLTGISHNGKKVEIFQLSKDLKKIKKQPYER